MPQAATTHERLPFDTQRELPEIDLVFSACRTKPGANFYDLVSFRDRTIDRWTVPFLPVPRAIDLLKQNVPADELPFGASSHEDHFHAHYMTPHTAQFCSDDRLFLGLGDPYNGTCIQVIDTREHRTHVLPEDFAEAPMLYASTGGFTPDGGQWLFVRWPFRDGLDIAGGRSELAECEIGALDTASLKIRTLHRLKAADRAHQVTCSPDGRYLVFSPFKWDLRVPYPAAPIEEEPTGYRRSHEAGIVPCTLVTVDLESGRHWETELTVPVTAHAHFDPADGRAFYFSAHNICPTVQGMMIEGPAAIYKLRIWDGETVIEGEYSDESFFRISQHTVFTFQGRTVVAVTNLPNHLDLIDGESMELWRRRELFPAPPLDLSATGNALCPPYPDLSLSLTASRDGRYVVLESARGWRVYDVEEDRLLDGVVPHRMPENGRPVGHMRTRGE